MRSIFCAALLSVTASLADAQSAGLRITDLHLPHHDETTRMAIWYPSTSSQNPTLYADSPVFHGVQAHLDGAVAPGSHPVVLFSHGMGGTDRAQAWLGAALAERGIVSVLVNHPNSTWGNFDMTKGVAHWTRTQDLSIALDALLAAPDFDQRLDLSRVMAAGFSFGGWTALSMGGATANHAGLVKACADRPDMEACGLLMSPEVNLGGIDPELWNASYADARVTHVTAIDPGLVWGLEQSDIDPLRQSTLMIGLGGTNDRMLAADFDQSGLTDLMGDRQIERFDPAFHFSLMPVCTERAEAILAAENDDPVCTDPVGTDRAALHAQIADLMAKQLGQ